MDLGQLVIIDEPFVFIEISFAVGCPTARVRHWVGRDNVALIELTFHRIARNQEKLPNLKRSFSYPNG
jgi:hypothetical protein